MSDQLRMHVHPTNLQVIAKMLAQQFHQGYKYLTILTEDAQGALFEPHLIQFPWEVVGIDRTVQDEQLSLVFWHNGGLSGFTFLTLATDNFCGPANNFCEYPEPAFFEVAGDVVVLSTQGWRRETEAEALSHGREPQLVSFPVRYELRRSPLLAS